MAKKKKKTKTFIWLLLLLLLAILTYIFMITQSKNKDKEENEEKATIATIDSRKVKEITYTNQSDVITLVKQDDTWVDKSDTKAPINQDYIDSMLCTLTKLEAEKIVVEKTDDLDEYGLKKPVIEVTVTASDSSFVLDIGDSLGTGNGHYAKLADSDMIYTVNNGVYTAFNYSHSQLVSVEEFPSITTTNMTDISIVKDNAALFKACYDREAADAGEYYAWSISKPYKTAVKGNPTQFDSYFECCSNITFNECVNYKGDNLAQYGLDNPKTSIDFTYYTEDISDKASTATTDSDITSHYYVLLVGNKTDNGDYYVQLLGSDRNNESAVYTLSSNTVDAMLTITPYTFVCNLVQLVDISTLDEFTVAADSNLYSFNNKEVEEETFKTLYQEIVGITTSGEINDKVKDNTPVYEFNFTRNSKDLENLNVKYLPYDGVNFYRVVVNGAEYFLVDKPKVDKVVQEIRDYKAK